MSAPPGRFAGLVAVITGGNSGIGRGIAHRFASERAKTAIVGRDANKGRAVAAELNERDARAEFSAADLADEQAVESLIDAVTERFARIDVLVNCAGVGSRRAGVEDDDGPGRRWDKLRRPNLDSTYFMCAYAMPALTPSGGAIVNISSTATWHGNWGLYGVAKAGGGGADALLCGRGGAARGASELRESGMDPYRAGRNPRLIGHRGRRVGDAAVATRAHGDAGRDRDRGRIPRLNRSVIHHRPDPHRRRGTGDHGLPVAIPPRPGRGTVALTTARQPGELH